MVISKEEAQKLKKNEDEITAQKRLDDELDFIDIKITAKKYREMLNG